jgi:hypothetical protein
VPAELERIVGKSLENDKDERYQVVKDLLLDLKRLKQRLEFEAEHERAGPSRAVSAGTITRHPRIDRTLSRTSTFGLATRIKRCPWLERGYENRDNWMVWLKVDPGLDGLRADPRFTNLLQRVGLAP